MKFNSINFFKKHTFDVWYIFKNCTKNKKSLIGLRWNEITEPIASNDIWFFTKKPVSVLHGQVIEAVTKKSRLSLSLGAYVQLLYVTRFLRGWSVLWEFERICKYKMISNIITYIFVGYLFLFHSKILWFRYLIKKVAH